jgi:hypothetical protein
MGEAIVFIINSNFAFRDGTHPLPRTVLTVSKYDFGLLKQSLAGGTDCVQEWTLTLRQNI